MQRNWPLCHITHMGSSPAEEDATGFAQRKTAGRWFRLKQWVFQKNVFDNVIFQLGDLKVVYPPRWDTDWRSCRNSDLRTRCGPFSGFGRWRTAPSAVGGFRNRLGRLARNQRPLRTSWRICAAAWQPSKAARGPEPCNGPPASAHPHLRLDPLRGVQGFQNTDQPMVVGNRGAGRNRWHRVVAADHEL